MTSNQDHSTQKIVFINNRHSSNPTIFFIILLIALIELLNTAWHSDDFLITMRTVLNFINGYGPVFNIDERVQAYTHPLWFLLLSGFSALFNNVIASMYFLSISMSLSVIWIIGTKIARNLWLGVLGACALMLSKAYVDFSTSGLENPLSHLLILFTIINGLNATKHQPSQNTLSLFFLTNALLYLTRPDLPLLVFPLSILVVITNRHTLRLLIKGIIIGLLPCITWTLFSLYYYGFPFPNTAYAKLGAGIPFHELLLQGLRYVKNSLITDPLTLCFIYFGTFVGFYASRLEKALACGIWLYLAYVLSIGGDFMSGRFFTAPLLIAVVLVSRSHLTKHTLQCAIIIFSLLAIKNLENTLFSGVEYANINIIDGIADERGFYFQGNSLVKNTMLTEYVSNWQVNHKSVSTGCGGLGIAGIKLGPGAHLIDKCALTDPLLARLPAKYNRHWRIGHFVRELPEGYLASIGSNTNLIKDPSVKDLYTLIRRVTRGPLNDFTRINPVINNVGLGKRINNYSPNNPTFKHGSF